MFMLEILSRDYLRRMSALSMTLHGSNNLDTTGKKKLMTAE
jgi:hypothetical protein